MAFRLDVSKLTLEQRHNLLKKYPEIDPRALGILPEAPAKEAAPKKGNRSRKAWRGSISFDSETEARIYDRLQRDHIAVIAHGKIALGDNRHLEPDFIIIHEVHDDGRFEGEMADAKGLWRGRTKTGKPTQKAHAEPDWKVKVDWLREKLGLIVKVLTS